MNKMERVSGLDNVTIKGNKVALIEPSVFEKVIDDNSNLKVVYSDDRLDLETAVDFILFTLIKEEHYIAEKLENFGCTQDYIGDQLGSQTYSSKHFSRTMASLERKKQEILKRAEEYARVQNKIADIKNKFMIEFSGEVVNND